jgi:hypothetical protein
MEERRKGEEEWGVLGWLGRISNENFEIFENWSNGG